MHLLTFLFEVVVISLSGVMAPGPMTAVTISKGNESPHAGGLVAVGHGVVEFPLMIALFYGFGYLLEFPYVAASVGFLGGTVLLIMAVGMLRSAGQVEMGSVASFRSPMVAGIFLTIGNPFFLVWWATVGAALILRSIRFGIVAFWVFAVLHWLCDFTWSYFLSTLSFRGGRFFGQGFQKIVFVVCGGFLLFSGGKLLADAARVLLT